MPGKWKWKSEKIGLDKKETVLYINICPVKTATEWHCGQICASGSVVEHDLAKVGAAGSSPVSRLGKSSIHYEYLIFLPIVNQGFRT